MKNEIKKYVLRFVGLLFTLCGIWLFISFFFTRNTEYAIIGLLSMILGELVDLPQRINEKEIQVYIMKKTLNKTNWRKQLKDEFGIHFKDSPDELQFLEAFIEDLLEIQRKDHEENNKLDEFDEKIKEMAEKYPLSVNFLKAIIGKKYK